MFRLAILLCCFTTSVLSADQCTAYNTCLAGLKEKWMTLCNIMKADKEAEMAVCFTNHNCAVPAHTPSPKMVALEACVSTAESEIQTCVSTKTAETVPLHVHRREHGHGEKNEHFEEDRMINASCGDNATAVLLVKLCLKGLNHCPSKQHYNHHDQEVRELHMKLCKANLTTACGKQMKNVTDAIWECSRNAVIETNFHNCTAPLNMTHHAAHKNETGKGKGKGKGKDDHKKEGGKKGEHDDHCENEEKEKKHQEMKRQHKDKEEELKGHHAEELKNFGKEWDEKKKELKRDEDVKEHDRQRSEEEAKIKERQKKEMEETKRNHEVEEECKKHPLAEKYSDKCNGRDQHKKRGSCPKKEKNHEEHHEEHQQEHHEEHHEEHQQEHHEEHHEEPREEENKHHHRRR